MALHLCHSFSSCGINVSSKYQRSMVSVARIVLSVSGVCPFSADVTFPQYKCKHTHIHSFRLCGYIKSCSSKGSIIPIIPLSRVIGVKRNMAQCNLIYMFPFLFNCIFMEISISNKLVLSRISRESFAIINLFDAYLGGATHIINWIIKIIRAQLSLYSTECIF